MTKPGGVGSGWIWISMVLFTVVEVVLGAYLGPLLAGRYLSHVGELRLEVMLIVCSYFIGGFLIGFLSPSVRVVEPALGACLAAMMPFLIGVFSPLRWFTLTTSRLFMAGGVAFALAMAGADAGERLCARLGNRASREYAGPDCE